MSREKVGKSIKEHRIAKKMTQKKLGEMLGKSESTVRMWELGKSTPPADIIGKLSHELDMNYYQLMQMAGHINNTFDELLLKRDKILTRQSALKNEKEELITKAKKIESELEKFIDKEMTSEEEQNVSLLVKERKELLERSEKLRNLIEDEYVEIDEINTLIRNALEYKEAKKAQDMIESFVGKAETKVDLENLFNIAQKITIGNKILSPEEKRKALQILKLTFDDN